MAEDKQNKQTVIDVDEFFSGTRASDAQQSPLIAYTAIALSVIALVVAVLVLLTSLGNLTDTTNDGDGVAIAQTTDESDPDAGNVTGDDGGDSANNESDPAPSSTATATTNDAGANGEEEAEAIEATATEGVSDDATGEEATGGDVSSAEMPTNTPTVTHTPTLTNTPAPPTATPTPTQPPVTIDMRLRIADRAGELVPIETVHTGNQYAYLVQVERTDGVGATRDSLTLTADGGGFIAADNTADYIESPDTQCNDGFDSSLTVPWSAAINQLSFIYCAPITTTTTSEQVTLSATFSNDTDENRETMVELTPTLVTEPINLTVAQIETALEGAPDEACEDATYSELPERKYIPLTVALPSSEQYHLTYRLSITLTDETFTLVYVGDVEGCSNGLVYNGLVYNDIANPKITDGQTMVLRLYMPAPSGTDGDGNSLTDANMSYNGSALPDIEFENPSNQVIINGDANSYDVLPIVRLRGVDTITVFSNADVNSGDEFRVETPSDDLYFVGRGYAMTENLRYVQVNPEGWLAVGARPQRFDILGDITALPGAPPDEGEE